MITVVYSRCVTLLKEKTGLCVDCLDKTDRLRTSLLVGSWADK